MRWIWAIILLQATAVSSASHKNVVTTEDICLSHVVTREALGEGLVGMKGVLDSIRYRMKRRKKNACAVISEKHQYSSIKQGEKLKYDEKLLRILSEVRTLPLVVKDADFFHSKMKKRPHWSREYKLIAKIGGHYFYQSTKENV